jgi:hypothetical protein
MAHGFLAINANGQVLVSSETRNLHFVGKALLNRTIRAFNGYGGLRHWAFQINCNVTPVPFFTMPVDAYYAVAAVRQVAAGVWEIEIIRSGTSDWPPEVYVFSDPRGATGNGGTNYGMLVMRDDSTPSFDSRLSPLAVTGGAMVAPPSNPLTSSPGGLSARNCGSDPQYSMAPDSASQYSMSAPGAKPIFFYPSIAQAEREFTYEEKRRECAGFDAYGACIGFGTEMHWTSTYWAFFRGGIRYVGGTLFCGWITAEFACNWSYSQEDSFTGIDYDDDSARGGTWPYSNETLNLTATAVIAANGARYD